MKRLLIIVSVFTALFLFSIPVFADSPVTSTQFSDAYQDISIVKDARQQGIVNAKIAAYLSNVKNPIDVKAAVINALSWNIDGKSNAEKYSKLVYKKSISKLRLESLSGDQLFCIGYMMAMDDYYEVKPALKYLKLAEKKISNSFTVSIVRAIVEAQSGLNSDWSNWKYIESVVQNNSLKKDMREDGEHIILDYMVEGFQVSQNNMLIENEKSQKVYLYGSWDFPDKLTYQIVRQSEKAYTSLSRDKYRIYYLNITGVENGNSTIEIKNNIDKSIKINFAVVSSDAYKNLNNTACMYIGSTKALIGKTKQTVNSNAVPYLKDNIQYVPIDFVNKAIGAKMQTDSKKGNSKITYAGKTISIKSGSNVININGKTAKLESNIENKNKQLFISAKDYATIIGKKYLYYDGLILFTNSEELLDTTKNDYILDEISTLLNDGKSILNYPTVFTEEGKYGYKDKEGKVVIKPTYDKASEFSEGLAAIAVMNDQDVLKYGFIDTKGNVIIKPVYDWAQAFVGGLAPAILNEKAGFIDKNSTVKIEFNYSGVGAFSGGLAPVIDIKSGKYGFIDTKGKLVIPSEYDECIGFSEGLAYVKIGDNWGCIDRAGKIIIKPTFTDVGGFVNGIMSVKLDDDWYTINKSGNLTAFFDNGDIYVGQHKNGVLNGKGTYTWADGTQYSGEFVEGKCTGKAVFTAPDGTVQEGYFEDLIYKGKTK